MKYSEVNAYPNIILHDCFATNIETKNNSLVLLFKDGFWMVSKTKYNPSDATIRTGVSEVHFTDFDCDNLEISLFERYKLFGKTLFTTQRSISLEQLCDNISENKWELEFIDELYAYHGAMFNCSIRLKNKPYYHDCQIKMDYFQDMVYYWNELKPDRIF